MCNEGEGGLVKEVTAWASGPQRGSVVELYVDMVRKWKKGEVGDGV